MKKMKIDIDFDREIEIFFRKHFESLPPEDHSEKIINNSINLLIEKKLNTQDQKHNFPQMALQKLKIVYSSITDYSRQNRFVLLRPRPVAALLLLITAGIIAFIYLNQSATDIEPVIANKLMIPQPRIIAEEPAVQIDDKAIAAVDNTELTRIKGKDYDDIYLYILERGIQPVLVDSIAAKTDSTVALAFSIIKDVLKQQNMKFKEIKGRIFTNWEYSGPVKDEKLYQTRIVFSKVAKDARGRINVEYQKFLTNEKKSPSGTISEKEIIYDKIIDEIKSRIRR